MRTSGISKLLLATAAVALVSGGAKADNALHRLGADFFKFNGTEFSTTLVPPGALFYTKTVTVPKGSNVLYVSIYATGDEHGGSRLELSCLVNGAFCRTNPGGVDGGPNGWIILGHIPNGGATGTCNNGSGGPGDCHDNPVTYQWCARIPSGVEDVTVDLRLASFISGQPVFIEKGHVYVDSSFIDRPDRCTVGSVSGSAPTVGEEDDALSKALAAAAKKGDTVAKTTKQH